MTSKQAWLAAFNAFEAMKPKIIVPSHGAVGDGSLIAVNQAVMQEVQELARDLKSQGRSADDTATLVQKKMQAKHPQWPRQRPRRRGTCRLPGSAVGDFRIIRISVVQNAPLTPAGSGSIGGIGANYLMG